MSGQWSGPAFFGWLGRSTCDSVSGLVATSLAEIGKQEASDIEA